MRKFQSQIAVAILVLTGYSFMGASHDSNHTSFFGVTTIVRWFNDSDYDYIVICPEQNKQFWIPKRSMIETSEVATRIPWVGPPSDVSFGHMLYMAAPNTSMPNWSIWQRVESLNGDKVRAEPKFKIGGAVINGHSDVDGNRHLRINKDGSILMGVEP